MPAVVNDISFDQFGEQVYCTRISNPQPSLQNRGAERGVLLRKRDGIRDERLAHKELFFHRLVPRVPRRVWWGSGGWSLLPFLGIAQQRIRVIEVLHPMLRVGARIHIRMILFCQPSVG